MERKMFHDGLVTDTEQGPSLIGKECPQCGYIQFPNGKICEKCGCDRLEDIPVGRTGTPFSYTTTYSPVQKLKPPFACGYVELPEGLHVFAPLRYEDAEAFEIGKTVELEIADLWQENDAVITGYRYRLADSAAGGTK